MKEQLQWSARGEVNTGTVAIASPAAGGAAIPVHRASREAWERAVDEVAGGFLGNLADDRAGAVVLSGIFSFRRQAEGSVWSLRLRFDLELATIGKDGRSEFECDAAA